MRYDDDDDDEMPRVLVLMLMQSVVGGGLWAVGTPARGSQLQWAGQQKDALLNTCPDPALPANTHSNLALTDPSFVSFGPRLGGMHPSTSHRN